MISTPGSVTLTLASLTDQPTGYSSWVLPISLTYILLRKTRFFGMPCYSGKILNICVLILQLFFTFLKDVHEADHPDWDDLLPAGQGWQVPAVRLPGCPRQTTRPDHHGSHAGHSGSARKFLCELLAVDVFHEKVAVGFFFIIIKMIKYVHFFQSQSCF